VEAVEKAANWPLEVTEALVGLVVRREAERIRMWNQWALYEVGLETSEERDPAARRASAEAYVDAVMKALEDLADLIEEEDEEGA
jgi:hypothetical protein